MLWSPCFCTSSHAPYLSILSQPPLPSLSFARALYIYISFSFRRFSFLFVFPLQWPSQTSLRLMRDRDKYLTRMKRRVLITIATTTTQRRRLLFAPSRSQQQPSFLLFALRWWKMKREKTAMEAVYSRTRDAAIRALLATRPRNHHHQQLGQHHPHAKKIHRPRERRKIVFLRLL